MSDQPTTTNPPSAPVQQPVQAPFPMMNPAPPPSSSGVIGLIEYFTTLNTAKAVTLSVVFTLLAILWTGKDKLIDALAASVAQHERARTDRVHDTALSDAVIRHRQVEAVLSSVREDAQSSRVVLFEYHNGSESLRGVPFLFQSATAEVVSPGVASVKDQAQRVPLSNTIAWIPDFLAHKCIDQVAETADQSLQSDMKNVGSQRIIACPVFIPGTKEPSGYVSAVYTKGWAAPDVAMVQGRLRDATRVIGATLGAYLDQVGR